MKRFVLFGIMLFMLTLQWESLQGQSYSMTNGQIITACSGTFYDSGGPNGHYSNNLDDTMTIVSGSSDSCLMVAFTSFVLENYSYTPYDYLRIYDGYSTASPLIGTYSGTSSPGVITSTSGALTFVFHSDFSVNNQGWAATINCTKYPIQLYLCPDSSAVIITADSAQSYAWSTGASTQSIAVSTAGTYTVTLTNASDVSVNTFQVSRIIMNPISSVSIPDMCAGDAYTVTVGHDSTSNISIGTHESIQTWTDTVFLPDGVPCEPYGCSYRSPLTFTSFSNDDTISSANDILYVRLNMEHSWAGDLYINLTCPNGQKADIMRFGGSTSSHSACDSTIPSSSVGWQGSAYGFNSNASPSTFFGLPYDPVVGDSIDKCDPTLSVNAPGTGWNYCWSNNTTAGFSYAPGAGSLIYRSAHAHYGTFDSSSVVIGPNLISGNQFYHPDQSFSSLIGCPLNGDWYIEVVDGWEGDNGYLFEWELALSKDVLSVYSDVDSTSLEGPWVATLNDSSYVITPPIELSQDTTVTYIIHCFDEYGCQYDTLVNINFFPVEQTIIDTIACDSLFWNDSLYTQSFSHSDTLTSEHGCDSIVTFQATILNSSFYEFDQIVCDSIVWYDTIYYESGDYTHYTYNQNGCDSLITMHLTVRKSCYVDTYDTACSFYSWNDIIYYSSGDYTQQFQNQYFCDSIVTLHLTIYSPDSIVVPALSCDSMAWEGSIYYVSGDYTKIFQNIHGCDSLVTLQLTILSSEDTAFYINACDSVSWEDVTYYGSGNYVIPLQRLNGCDSLINLHVTIWNTDYIDVYDKGCDFYEWQGNIYYESGDYIFSTQNEHGCDSVITLHLTIWNSDHIDIYDTACDFFSWNNTIYYESGDYTMYYQNIHNCDSIETLHLTIYSSDIVDLYDTVCDSLVWNDSIYYESGDYIFLTQNQNGCDSLVTLHLAVRYSNWTDIYDTTCDSFVWNDSVYDETGVYQQYFQNQEECDSIVTLHLTVWYSNSEEIMETECDSFVWNDSTYYESGNYTKHFLNVNGCDSVATLHLTLGHTNFTELYDTVCDGFVWNNSFYDVSGDYQQTFLNGSGCDSTVMLHLIVCHSSQTDIYDTACDSFVWNDITYYESGNYLQYFHNSEGCDSVMTLHLTIFHSDVIDVYKEVCDSLIWNDSIYYESGNYVKYYQNNHGCDSITMLHLIIMSTTPIVRYESACDSFAWNDSIYYESGEYVQVFSSVEGCDSTVVVNLTVTNTEYLEESVSACDSLEWNGVTYYESGDYTVTLTNQDGCDSLVTLHLTLHHSFDTLISLTVNENALPYILNGYEYDSSGTYIQTLTSSAGCDSVITILFTVHHSVLDLSVLAYMVDNSNCDGIPGTMDTSVACNGRAFVVVEGGVPPYSYQWDDPLAQQTDTAKYLCAGQYMVTVTDNAGDTAIATVIIADYVPKVNHDDGHFCFSDSIAVLHGSPTGGVYTGALMNGDTLVFQDNVTVYTLTYTYTDEHGCTASTQFQVTVTMNTRSEDTLICSSDLPYVWYGQVLTVAGTYQKLVPMDTLCDSLISLHLSVLQQPQLTVSEDVVIDPGESTTLSVSGAGSYVWSPAASLSSATSANPIASPSQSTKYYVTGFASANCFSTDSVNVLVRQYFDTILCENNMPLQWHGVTITDTAEHEVNVPNPDGLDEVLVLHVHLLRNTSSIVQDTVMENDLPLIFNGIAFNDDVTDSMMVIPNNVGCDSVIRFSLYVCRNQTIMMDSVVCESDLPLFWNNQVLYEENTYQADLQTICGSDSAVILNLSVIDTALKIISYTEDFCSEMSMELFAVSPLTNYEWNTGEVSPNITVYEPGLYSVTASQEFCQNTAYYLVRNCDYQLILPNAFSPNLSEGLNDYFCIPESYLRFINLFEISIFNRWGQLVFYSTDKNFKWNGEYNGQIQPNTTYNYVIRYTTEAGVPFVIKGSVTVL